MPALTAVVAWQLGELLGAGPTEAQLADVGAVVTTSLTLGSLPALAIAPFAALLAYLVPVITVHATTSAGRRSRRRRRPRRAGRDDDRPLADARAGRALGRGPQLTVMGAANWRSGTGTAPSVCSSVSSRRSSRDSAASRRRVADSASRACRSSVVSRAADATR